MESLIGFVVQTAVAIVIAAVRLATALALALAKLLAALVPLIVRGIAALVRAVYRSVQRPAAQHFSSDSHTSYGDVARLDRSAGSSDAVQSRPEQPVPRRRNAAKIYW